MSTIGLRTLIAAAGALACSLALAAPVSAAVFTVDDLDDVHDADFGGTFDGVCDAPAADTCTLRAASTRRTTLSSAATQSTSRWPGRST